MAFGDYHACDNCGEQKTFYDANHDITFVDGHWRYDYVAKREDCWGRPGYRVLTLCAECEKTHEIVIQPKEPNHDP